MISDTYLFYNLLSLCVINVRAFGLDAVKKHADQKHGLNEETKEIE